jgi:hypothetical protein
VKKSAVSRARFGADAGGDTPPVTSMRFALHKILPPTANFKAAIFQKQ